MPDYNEMRERQARATADRLDGAALTQQIHTRRRNQCILDGGHTGQDCQRCGL